MTDSTLAVRLRDARKSLKLSQRTFAEHVGVTQNKVYRWEAAKGFPNPEELKRISRLSNLSLDWLICGISLDEKVELVGVASSRTGT